jgi:hypothetical protein
MLNAMPIFLARSTAYWQIPDIAYPVISELALDSI